MNAHNEQHDPACIAAYEQLFQADSRDPSQTERLAVWARSWNAARAAWSSPVVKQNLTTQPAAAQLGDRLDRAYAERNALAIAFAKAALAAGWRAGRGYDDDQSKDWAPQWRHVVYVDLPDGRQVSWHMAPAEVELLDRLPQYAGEWNGEFTARDPSWCRFDAPAAAQEAVAWMAEPVMQSMRSRSRVFCSDKQLAMQWDYSGHPDYGRMIVTPLYAAPVAAAPADAEEDAYVIDQMGKLLAEIAVIVNGPEPAGTRWSYHDLPAKVKALASTPAAPGIDLREIGEAMAEAEQHVETLHSLCSRPSVLACIKRLRKAQAALIDANPKGALNEQFGSAEGLDSPKGGIAPCAWTDDGEGNWDTACGERLILLEGSPTDNKMRHCPYCGSHISESAQAGDAEVQP